MTFLTINVNLFAKLHCKIVLVFEYLLNIYVDGLFYKLFRKS